MPRYLIPLGIVAVGVIIYSFIECLTTPKHQVRAFPKAAWIVMIILLPLIGALLWLFLGRARTRRGGSGGGRPATPPRPSSPDDDAAFLRQLDVQRQQAERQRALDRREAELRDREEKTDSPDGGHLGDPGSTPPADRPDDGPSRA